MNIAISGFNNDYKFIKFLQDCNFKISNTVENVEFLVIKEDLDYIEHKSSKIKLAMTNRIPIITYCEFLKYFDYT